MSRRDALLQIDIAGQRPARLVQTPHVHPCNFRGEDESCSQAAVEVGLFQHPVSASAPCHHLSAGRSGRHRPDSARHHRHHPPIASATAMRLTPIYFQTERKRQDRSGRCAEKHRCRDRTRRFRDLIRPVTATCTTAGAPLRAENACQAGGFTRSSTQAICHVGNQFSSRHQIGLWK